MNAVFGMTHFCEVHGPKVIFVTQAFKASDSLSILKNRLRRCPTDRWMNYSCPTCQSIPSGLYVSNDVSSQYSFISSTNSLDPHLYKRLNHVALRVHSCERFRGDLEPKHGRTGVIIVDDQRLLGGTVFAYGFSAKDRDSRGHNRNYAVFVILKDKHWVLRHFPLLFDRFGKLADKIHSRAYQLYLKSNEILIKPHVLQDLSGLLQDSSLYARLHSEFVQNFQLLGQNFREYIFSGSQNEKKILSILEPSPVQSHRIKRVMEKLTLKEREHLCFSLLCGRCVQVECCSRMEVEMTLEALEIFTPPSSSKKVLNECQGCLGIGDVQIRLTPDFRLESLTSIDDHYASTLVMKIIKILNKPLTNEMISRCLNVLREEILGMTKTYSKALSQNRNVKDSALRTMNCRRDDCKILEAWTSSHV